jgi:hypothetical protein
MRIPVWRVGVDGWQLHHGVVGDTHTNIVSAANMAKRATAWST